MLVMVSPKQVPKTLDTLSANRTTLEGNSRLCNTFQGLNEARMESSHKRAEAKGGEHDHTLYSNMCSHDGCFSRGSEGTCGLHAKKICTCIHKLMKLHRV